MLDARAPLETAEEGVGDAFVAAVELDGLDAGADAHGFADEEEELVEGAEALVEHGAHVCDVGEDLGGLVVVREGGVGRGLVGDVADVFCEVGVSGGGVLDIDIDIDIEEGGGLTQLL